MFSVINSSTSSHVIMGNVRVDREIADYLKILFSTAFVALTCKIINESIGICKSCRQCVINPDNKHSLSRVDRPLTQKFFSVSAFDCVIAFH